MENLSELWRRFASYSIAEIPFLIALALVAGVLSTAWWVLLRRDPDVGTEERLPRQLAMIGLWIAAVVILVLALPVSESMRSGLLSLLSVVLSAAIALSSTTFIGNAIAGLMLRSVGRFRPGDFLHVGEHFGRVTERGLVHTEIQTEDRDLTTLPNLFLVQNPVSVVRRSGTIVSATVSLGYDVPRKRVEACLLDAVDEAHLSDGFVQVAELEDFAVQYRVAGFLPEVRHLLTARSTLRKKMLDALHGAGIEIVSPTFMNQRQLVAGKRVIPPEVPAHAVGPQPAPDAEGPEGVIFDKADAAERVEMLKDALEGAKQKLAQAQSEGVEPEVASLAQRVARLEARLEAARSDGEED